MNEDFNKNKKNNEEQNNFEELKKNFSGEYFNLERNELTGSKQEFELFEFVKYPFDRYIVTVKLSPEKEFLGITEIKLNKDFRNYREKQVSQSSLNIEKYYFIYWTCFKIILIWFFVHK